MKNKINLEIRTFKVGEKFQHKVFESLPQGDRELAISDEVVELYKKANERLYQEIPVGSNKLTLIVRYQFPKKPKSF